MLLAQTTEIFSGASGWAGAGLLGLILSWLLLKHLPEKDRQIKEFIDNKDAHIKDIAREYRESLKEVTAHCQQEIIHLTNYWQNQMGSLTRAIEDLSEKIEHLGLPGERPK